MVPAVRRDELHDVRNTITNEGLESTRVPVQPADDDSAVGPSEYVFSWHAQCLLGVMKELCE